MLYMLPGKAWILIVHVSIVARLASIVHGTQSIWHAIRVVGSMSDAVGRVPRGLCNGFTEANVNINWTQVLMTPRVSVNTNAFANCSKSHAQLTDHLQSLTRDIVSVRNHNDRETCKQVDNILEAIDELQQDIQSHIETREARWRVLQSLGFS